MMTCLSNSTLLNSLAAVLIMIVQIYQRSSKLVLHPWICVHDTAQYVVCLVSLSDSRKQDQPHHNLIKILEIDETKQEPRVQLHRY